MGAVNIGISTFLRKFSRIGVGRGYYGMELQPTPGKA